MKTALSAASLRRIEDLPGPRAWRLLGSALQVKPARIHQDIEAWSRQYGALFRVKLGLTQMLVVADHEAVLAMLRDLQRYSLICNTVVRR